MGIDVSGLNSMYADYLSAATPVTESGLRLDSALKGDKSGKTDEELMEVCKQFESYFLEQVFKEMKKTVPEHEYSSQSISTSLDFFEDQTIQNIAAQSTDKNQLGLAQMLYDQMKRNTDT